MNVESSIDRTARWVQQHSQRSIRQQSAASRSSLKPPRQEGTSSQQSSRTDLGGHNNAVGSGGRAYGRQPSTSYAYAHQEFSRSSRQPAVVEEPLSSSHHQRSRSHSTSVPRDHRTPPRLNIPTTLYRNPNLPAFVQGPPGSGYPMSMTASTQRPPLPIRAVVPTPPSPPLQVPNPLNPKKSRPTVHKRRPSLSGATFEPPIQPSYPYQGPDDREPRVQGQGDVYRARGRSASESRRR